MRPKPKGGFVTFTPLCKPQENLRTLILLLDMAGCLNSWNDGVVGLPDSEGESNMALVLSQLNPDSSLLML